MIGKTSSQCMFVRLLSLVLAAGLLIGQKIPPATFSGTVHGVSSKQVTIENADGNLLDFEINRKTRILRGKKQIGASELETGDTVTIEAREEMGRFLVAITITVEPKSKD